MRTKTKPSVRAVKRDSRSQRRPQDDLSSVANLGPKSAQVLASAGITTFEKLRELGSVRAYAAAKRAGANVSLNLLWALEAALTGSTWRDVARFHRTSLLLALDDFERGN
jgi:DNA transformation protein